MDLSNYKQYTTYDQNTSTLTIKKGVIEITNVFKDGYIPDPSKPNDTVPIDSLTLPSSLVQIDDNAFYGSELTSLTIPDSVTSIGNRAFYNSKLTTLTFVIGKSLKTIGEEAFYSAITPNLLIPHSVINIGDATFWNVKNATSYKKIIVSMDRDYYDNTYDMARIFGVDADGGNIVFHWN